MPDNSPPYVESGRITRQLLVAWLVIGWLWAGIPLAAGVYFSVVKSKPLFDSAAPVVPGK